MNQELGAGWSVAIDRGPGWLFVGLQGPESGDGGDVDLADGIGGLVDREFTNRLVLEMEDVPVLPSQVIGELIKLRTHLTESGGVMRIAGLSDSCYAGLQANGLADLFPQYRDRRHAVRGHRPSKPR